MKIAICDDVIRDCKYLKKCCEQSKVVQNVEYSIFLSGNELLSSLESGKRFDIIFLDIDMPEINGIDVGNSIRRCDKNVIIVFVTNYSEFAIDAYECEAFNYLLKPCDPQKFNDVLTRAVDRLGLLHKYHVVKIRNQTFRIPISEVYYIECCRKHIIYHLKTEKIETTDTLSNVYNALSQYGFLQVHQGFVVNMSKIKRFEDYSVILDDGSAVMVSVRKKNDALITYAKYIERYTR